MSDPVVHGAFSGHFWNHRDMGYKELLPQGEDISKKLIESGFDNSQRQTIFDVFGEFLREHAEYYENQYDKIGERDDRGAAGALHTIADWFESESRYSSTHKE